MFLRWRCVMVVALAMGFLLLRVVTMKLPFTVLPQEQQMFHGAMHVHSNLSFDANQTVETIASDAARAHLQFVILTDHQQRAPSSRYIDSVLILNGTEISLPHGHVLALGGEFVSPKNHESVSWSQLSQRGAMLGAAHPDSLKNPLTDSDVLHADAYELLSGSSDFYRLLRSYRMGWLLFFPLRPALALSHLYPSRALAVERYDQLLSLRPLRLWCGVDDHGRVHTAHRLRTYVTYLPTMMPENNAEHDAEQIDERLKKGESFCALGLYGDASALSITAKSGRGIDTLGAELEAPVEYKARWNGPRIAGHRFLLYRNGELLQETTSTHLEVTLSEPGAYRLEAARDVPTLWFGTHSVRWIYTNPIFVRSAFAQQE